MISVSVGIRSEEGREEFRRLFESAIDVPGPATEFVGKVVREHGLHLVVGVIERDGGTLYCTALMFAPDGSLLGKHRKLMPTAMERVIWGGGDGSTLTVVPTEIGRIGSVNLLGELHAVVANGDVRQADRTLFRLESKTGEVRFMTGSTYRKPPAASATP